MTIPSVPPAATVALLAAALWAISMILLKRGLAAGGTIIQGSVVVASVDSIVYWLTIGTLAVGGRTFAGFSLAVIPIFVVSGTIGTALGRVLSFDGIDRVGASVNSAAISTRPLFGAVLALLALGEAVSFQTAIGVVILVAGLIVLARSNGGDIRGWQPRDLVLPLGAAMLFATSDVVRRFGLTSTPVSPLEAVAFHETAGVAALIGLVVLRSDWNLSMPPRRITLVFLASGIFNAISLLLYFQALALPGGSVAIVAALVGTAPIFVTLFGTVLLGDLERITPWLAGAAVLVVVGAALITIA